ncbi:MAG: hypothetical protein AB1778_09410, partial [Candidatus Bipolaricaulota bacterium]
APPTDTAARTPESATSASTTAQSVPPTGAPTASTSQSGTMGTGEGVGQSGSAPTPIFDDAVGAVAVVSPEARLGASGGATAYLTRAVPIERGTGDPSVASDAVLAPSAVHSALGGRTLPEETTQIIRDYFTRITEERE